MTETEKEKHRCQVQMISGGKYPTARQCDKVASKQIDGRWYCHQHTEPIGEKLIDTSKEGRNVKVCSI